MGVPQPYEALPHGSLRSWETWISLGLVLVAFMAVTSSIEQADWVPEMPSLSMAAFLGLAMGFGLARLRGPGVGLLLLALPLGAATTLLQSMYAMQLSDPALGTGFEARWDELVLRLQDWVAALLSGDVSTDPLPFILLMVLLSWTMAFAAAWAVFRARNGWLAVVPGGVALLTNISYLPGQPSLAFIVYVFAGVLLVTRMHAVRAVAEWRAERTARPRCPRGAELRDLVGARADRGGLGHADGEPLGAVRERVAGRRGAGADRAGAGGPRVFRRRLEARRPGAQVRGGAAAAGPRSASSTLLSVEAPPEAVYLRGAVYDEYTGRLEQGLDDASVALPARA